MTKGTPETPRSASSPREWADWSDVLPELLKDRTTGGAIVWATDAYAALGARFAADAEITPETLDVVAPGCEKNRETRAARAKENAEVFTPTRICNAQNNLVDDAWFERKGVFNVEGGALGWTPTPGKIAFRENVVGARWEDYVEAPRLEAACGEAPYLVSRRDVTTGAEIPLASRVGLLDRKLRVVAENTKNIADWTAWTTRAFQSVYGFELQGDNLFLARWNLFATFLDAWAARRKGKPAKKLLTEIAEIISWNLWQMDALTNMPPGGSVARSLLGAERSISCKIRDWRGSGRIFNFSDLINKKTIHS
ncbi:MAG: restriction endonuclease subunit M [Thermoguttaceae bacterium]|nr:restriction endonuclease subunit M [Thermoguttaceae bacterium]